MKISIHNEYAAINGEEIEFYGIVALLREHGHTVELYTRSSARIEKMTFGKARILANLQPFSETYS
jgi:hypothetical protein